MMAPLFFLGRPIQCDSWERQDFLELQHEIFQKVVIEKITLKMIDLWKARGLLKGILNCFIALLSPFW